MDVDGLLLVDKPQGWTSFDVVAKVRGLVKQATSQKRPKVGHAGTLDPLATGLLIILVGSYCKRAADYSKLDKTYKAELTLGKTSTTDDGEGDLTPFSAKKPSNEDISGLIKEFIGTIEQVPPAFSAIKVDGQRAYKLARSGKSPEMKARTVTIRSIKEVAYHYPKLSFVTEVSSGTYIRSLARDMGERLGTGAYLSALRRVSIGGFKVNDAHNIGSLNPNDISGLLIEH